MNSSSSNHNIFTEEEGIKYNNQSLFKEEEIISKNQLLFSEEEDINIQSTNDQHLFTEEEDIKHNDNKDQYVFGKEEDTKSFGFNKQITLIDKGEDITNNANIKTFIENQHTFEEEEEEADDQNIISTNYTKQLIEEEEEEEADDKNIISTNYTKQLIEEEEEEEDSFIFEQNESDVKYNYLDDDHVELITENDDDTIKLLKKLDNINLDLDKIENTPVEPQFEEEEEEGNQTQSSEEEDTNDDDTFSISDFDLSISKDTKELFNVIDNLQIENQPEKEKPLQAFDPALTKEELSTNDHLAEKQFNFQDSFVYRDIEADMKPFKQRGNKRAIYDELHTFDCVALVVDPSKPENEINDYVTSEFNQADEAAIITARAKDNPLPDYEILTPYSGEIESLILQAYLDFNDL